MMRSNPWLGRNVRVVVAGALIGCSRAPEPSAAQTITGQAAGTIDQSRRTAITDAVAKVAPAVVTVQTEVIDQSPPDPFTFFFGGPAQPRTQAGLGSGFIV